MYQNIILKSIGTYHPKREFSNSYFVEYFKNLGRDVNNLESNLDNAGRQNRFLAEVGKENVLTMAVEASKKAFAKAKLEPKDIDMIIFATDTPEYLSPTNALLLNYKLKALNANIAFDINNNCTGMLTGMQIASSIMLSNTNVKHCLLAGSMFASLIINKKDPLSYSNFADSGAAVILEKVEENEKRGFIDSGFKTDPIMPDQTRWPSSGMSNMFNDLPIENKKLSFSSDDDMNFVSEEWATLIGDMLIRNNISINEIKQFFFSQLSKKFAENALRKLNLPVSKHTYVGNRYGYTGVTSPIMALNYAFRHKAIGEGDKIVLCSMGAGYNIVSILLAL